MVGQDLWRAWAKEIGLALLVTALATGVSALMSGHLAITDMAMVYLLGVAWVAASSTRRAAFAASVLAVAAFNFSFVHPKGTFQVADVQYVFTFAVMLLTGLLISSWTANLREQSRLSSLASLRVQIEQARSDLLSSVSHDLRTPLASIEGSADALLEQPGISEQSRLLASTIQGESRRMARLIRNLLDMTRVQGSLILDLDWQSLDELASNAILRTEGMFASPVELIAPQEALAWVDGVLVEQTLVNLLENAARHAGPDAHVIVRIAESASEFTICVEDDGPGIEPGSEDQIFERFHSKRKGGAGLGLAICRAAVESHGGTIAAENRPEGGARFRIHLPKRKDTPL